MAGAEAGRLRLLSGRWRSTRLKEVGLRRDALAEEVSFGVRVERAAESSGSDDDDDDGAAAPSSGALRTFFCLGGRGTAGRRPAGRVTTARSSRSFDVPWSATMASARCLKLGGRANAGLKRVILDLDLFIPLKGL